MRSDGKKPAARQVTPRYLALPDSCHTASPVETLLHDGATAYLLSTSQQLRHSPQDFILTHTRLGRENDSFYP